MPGLVVAIARNGRLVYAAGFGVADQKSGENVKPSHLFRVGGVGKPVTSVAIRSGVEAAWLGRATGQLGARNAEANNLGSLLACALGVPQ